MNSLRSDYQISGSHYSPDTNGIFMKGKICNLSKSLFQDQTVCLWMKCECSAWRIVKWIGGDLVCIHMCQILFHPPPHTHTHTVFNSSHSLSICQLICVCPWTFNYGTSHFITAKIKARSRVANKITKQTQILFSKIFWIRTSLNWPANQKCLSHWVNSLLFEDKFQLLLFNHFACDGPGRQPRTV